MSIRGGVTIPFGIGSAAAELSGKAEPLTQRDSRHMTTRTTKIAFSSSGRHDPHHLRPEGNQD